MRGSGWSPVPYTKSKKCVRGSSYLSQNALRVHFGLGTHAQVDRVEIRWPSGIKQVLENVAADQFLTIQEPEKL